MNKPPYQLENFSGPLPPRLARQLITWWESIFKMDLGWLAAPLTGKEAQYNTSSLYIYRQSDLIISTCRLVQSRTDVRLGCLGEVATRPDFRRQGLARKLCQHAADDFERGQGKALFLATENPSPARQLYSALGWKPVAGSNAMVRLPGTLSVDRFLSDYFHEGSSLPVRIVRGSPQFRVTMIPLILVPHDWMTLDRNAAITSTRYAVQPSCEGLYGRYALLNIPAAWFAAVRADGVVAGLSSAKRTTGREFCVDGFAHNLYEDACLKPLYQEVIHWAREQDCEAVCTACARTDYNKETALRTHLSDELPEIKYF
ncbi:MAG: GNAT family N-acetyltransferase [Spirochaetales bacterium]|nr:GNAT family N-acetyltransferase [Spirochaetales bacterium]